MRTLAVGLTNLTTLGILAYWSLVFTGIFPVTDRLKPAASLAVLNGRLRHAFLKKPPRF